MSEYEVVESIDSITGQPISFITRRDSSGVVWHIPIDESNTDYLRYLEWLGQNSKQPPVVE